MMLARLSRRILVVMAVSLAAIAFAQDGEHGWLMGTTSRMAAGPQSGTLMRIIETGQTAYSNDSGRYSVSNLKEGTYNLKFSHPGMKDFFASNVEITAGDTTIVNATLDELCDYVPGDLNNDGVANLGDVEYGLDVLGNYYWDVPILTVPCRCPPIRVPFYAAGDVNGNCSFNGIDVTYYMSYFRGGPPLRWCVDCPPGVHEQ